MEIINIKISRYTEVICGIRLYENENVLGIVQNSGDYILDGICFINKKYIRKIEKEKDVLKTKIFENKFKNTDCIYFSSIKEILNYFTSQPEKLIQINLESPSYSLIGRVCKLNEKSFILDMLSIKAEFLREINLDFEKVRILTINNDYLSSLEYYLNESMK